MGAHGKQECTVGSKRETDELETRVQQLRD